MGLRCTFHSTIVNHICYHQHRKQNNKKIIPKMVMCVVPSMCFCFRKKTKTKNCAQPKIQWHSVGDSATFTILMIQRSNQFDFIISFFSYPFYLSLTLFHFVHCVLTHTIIYFKDLMLIFGELCLIWNAVSFYQIKFSKKKK